MACLQSAVFGGLCREHGCVGSPGTTSHPVDLRSWEAFQFPPPEPDASLPWGLLSAPAMFSLASHPQAPHTTQVGYQRCLPELVLQGCSVPNNKKQTKKQPPPKKPNNNKKNHKRVGAGSTGLIMQWLIGKPNTNMVWKQCLHFSDWMCYEERSILSISLRFCVLDNGGKLLNSVILKSN